VDSTLLDHCSKVALVLVSSCSSSWRLIALAIFARFDVNQYLEQALSRRPAAVLATRSRQAGQKGSIHAKQITSSENGCVVLMCIGDLNEP
jgi:riboflavin synthase